jgi:alpha-tubulin suppressor-like RCC1 family protein
LNSFSKIWAVGTATFATDSSGKLYGTGANNWGQLGTVSGSVIVNMTLISVPNTVSVGGADTITQVTGSTEYTMFLTSAGNLYASGLDSNQYSRFGQNSTGKDIYPFLNFTLVIQGIGSVDTQLSSTIAISTDQTKVYGWGDNANSRLCLPLVQVGTKFAQVVPTLIPSLSNQPFKVIRSKLGTTHTIFM